MRLLISSRVLASPKYKTSGAAVKFAETLSHSIRASLGRFKIINLRDISGEHIANDEVNGEQPSDQVNYTNGQTTSDDPSKDDMPKEPEPQLDAIGIESSNGIVDAGDSTDIVKVGLTGKENSVSLQCGKFPFFNTRRLIKDHFALTDYPFASGDPGKLMDDVAEKSPIEKAPFVEPAALEPRPEPTGDEANRRSALRNEQPVEESEERLRSGNEKRCIVSDRKRRPLFRMSGLLIPSTLMIPTSISTPPDGPFQI